MSEAATVTAVDERTGEYLDEETQRALAARLARVEGHVRAIRQMVLDRRCADDILIQTSAVKAALNTFAAALLEHELRTCMETCMPGDRAERLDRISRLFATLLKRS